MSAATTSSTDPVAADPVEPDGGGQALVERRLVALRGEFENGQARLLELERQEAFLRERLLMLRVAIQALDDLQSELAAPETGEPSPGA